MPYIHKVGRKQLEQLFEDANGNFENFLSLLEDGLYGVEGALVDADVCYLIYKILVRLYGKAGNSWSTRMNSIKILESAKDEFMQNYVRPYERKAKERNGDVT
jgi:hypothetical protein